MRKKLPTQTIDKTVVDVVQALFDGIAKHDDHTWEQVGRCVYCADCSERLYQGRISSSHLKVKRRGQGQTEPKSTTEMRKRWNKE